jgi:hypothetical protein
MALGRRASLNSGECVSLCVTLQDSSGLHKIRFSALISVVMTWAWHLAWRRIKRETHTSPARAKQVVQAANGTARGI